MEKWIGNQFLEEQVQTAGASDRANLAFLSGDDEEAQRSHQETGSRSKISFPLR